MNEIVTSGYLTPIDITENEVVVRNSRTTDDISDLQEATYSTGIIPLQGVSTGVKVRNVDWKDTPDGGAGATWAFGFYTIYSPNSKYGKRYGGYHACNRFYGGIGTFQTLEEAKMAVQIYHNEKVLECLEVKPDRELKCITEHEMAEGRIIELQRNLRDKKIMLFEISRNKGGLR